MGKEKPEKENLFSELRGAYEGYFDILENGAEDPAWEDGVNANLCANHFHYYMNMIKEKHPEKKWGCLDWIADNVLVEVPQEYMARKDEIREGAAKALSSFNADKNLAYIRRNIGIIGKKEREKKCLDNILGYYTNLQSAIKENDLVAMRRYERPQTYLDAFKKGAADIKKMDLGLFGGYGL